MAYRFSDVSSAASPLSILQHHIPSRFTDSVECLGADLMVKSSAVRAGVSYTCQGPWKIYGDPRSSLRCADAYRQTRKAMSRTLSCCISPCECLGRAATGKAFF
jgi:hypothetical protein